MQKMDNTYCPAQTKIGQSMVDLNALSKNVGKDTNTERTGQDTSDNVK